MLETNNTPTLSTAQVQAILQFLSRTQITGAEAPAFMECVMALRIIAAASTQTAPTHSQSA